MEELTFVIRYARTAENKGDWTLASLRWRTASRMCNEAFKELYIDNAKECERIAKRKILEPEMA